MSERLNKRRVDPAGLARTGHRLDGVLDLAELPRLTALLTSGNGAVTVALRFGIDDGGQPGITGEVVATLQMACQRCLQSMPLEVRAAVSLGIVRSSEQAQELPAQYEPLIVDDDPVSVAALVEDELILALPIVAMHPPAECAVADPGTAGEAVPPAPDKTTAGPGEKAKKNPFAVLEKLRERR